MHEEYYNGKRDQEGVTHFYGSANVLSLLYDVILARSNHREETFTFREPRNVAVQLLLRPFILYVDVSRTKQNGVAICMMPI